MYSILVLFFILMMNMIKEYEKKENPAKQTKFAELLARSVKIMFKPIILLRKLFDVGKNLHTKQCLIQKNILNYISRNHLNLF